MNANLYLFRVSVVLVNSDPGFSLFLPKNLVEFGIADANWKPQVAIGEETVHVQYDNSVVIKIEGNKLIIEEMFGEDNLANAEFPKIIKSLLERFSHLSFLKLGFNLDLMVKEFEPRVEYLEHLFATGAGVGNYQKEESIPLEVRNRTVLPMPDGSFSVGSHFRREVSDQKLPALTFHTNRHIDLNIENSQTSQEEVLRHLSEFPSHVEYAREFISNMLPKMEEPKDVRTGS